MSRFIAPLVLATVLLALPAVALANDASLGPHLGINFDFDDPFLGLGGRFDVGRLSSSVVVQLNPSFSYYFIDNADLFNFSLNVPFEFVVSGTTLRPFAAPGIGLWHYSNGGSDTDLSFNILAGLLFELKVVEPFFQLKINIGDGSSAELMGGALFVL
jgi:hypothetical protein